MAESILFSLTGKIIMKLGSFAGQELALLWGVVNELDKLKRMLSAIQAVVLDAEEQQFKSHAVKDWISKLKDALYDIEDLFDELSYATLRMQVMARDNRRKTYKQVCMFFSKSNPIAFALKMGHKIKAIRERLADIGIEKTQFKFSECVIINIRDDGLRKTRETGSYIPEEEVIDRNDDKKAIINLLLKPNTNRDPVISIVGMGGLGKTALAQSIYNDNMLVEHFDLKLWVCVSEEFEVKVIIEKIIESATGKRPESCLQMDSLQSKLRKLVDEKKYLLIMDDVWNEDHEKWVILRQSLIDGAKGSRILITTRSEQVAKTFDSSPLYFVESLDEDNSWLLFKKMTFCRQSEQDLMNSNLVEIGKEIVAKLKGVPLAIKTIGRLLYAKKSEDRLSKIRNFTKLRNKEV
ncbi:LOW QUALITY PROTEIN: putative disease resistance protein RGA3 [Momordica charantia]|uniref:LOW QUALITY PROTEIN: putative disease resistance protein RGA3 n=1 Tax=Momordica charantia TaxID=3673 RepID=A0A6J1DCG4_MOMCH|nr:LOW QUALITY PROTEIN: putative disease resistance protein RGA3 [Momordica charantia]